MRVIIDRFEGDFAVVELPDKTFCNVPKMLFENVAEGDVFDITKNTVEAEQQKEKIQKIVNKLFE